MSNTAQAIQITRQRARMGMNNPNRRADCEVILKLCDMVERLERFGEEILVENDTLWKRLEIAEASVIAAQMAND